MSDLPGKGYSQTRKSAYSYTRPVNIKVGLPTEASATTTHKAQTGFNNL